MKKIEPRTSILYVKVTEENKQFIEKKSQELYGSKRKESIFINDLIDELRENKTVKIEK